MIYLMITLAAGVVVCIAANEIGKFIDDISPYDFGDLDADEESEMVDCQWK